MAGTHPLTPRPPRTRRTKNFWEPIYNPSTVERFPYADWRTACEHGATWKTLSSRDLSDVVQGGFFPKAKNVQFMSCDFFGSVETVVVFENCKFLYCDFGLSAWRRAKFTNCEFNNTSFTQCEFVECEFRGCDWISTGLSGNETRFDKTLIDNPKDFVDSAFLNIDDDILKSRGTNRDRQLVRFWETKSVVARQLYNDLKSTGDEDSFYKACKAFIQATCRYKFERAWRPGKRKDGIPHRKYTLRLISTILEMGLIRLIASINKWGESVIRPLLLLIACFIVFSVVYFGFGFESFHGSVRKSFEITSIAGYTRGAKVSPTFGLLLAEWLNLVSAIVFYTVFFSTIVSKICRVR